MPFGVVNSLGWLTPVATFFLAMVLFGIDNIAVEIEEPFGRDENDVDVESKLLAIDRETACLVAAHAGARAAGQFTPEDCVVCRHWHPHNVDRRTSTLQARSSGTINSRSGESARGELGVLWGAHSPLPAGYQSI